MGLGKGALGRQSSVPPWPKRVFPLKRAMAKPNIFPPTHLKFIHQLYLKMQQSPSEVTVQLNRKYGTNYAIGQVQRAINNRGWSKRRKLMQVKVREIEVVTDRVLAKTIAKEHEETIKEVAAGMVTGARKALDFVHSASTVNELAKASTAMKSFMSGFKIASGIEDSRSRPNTINYTYDFGRMKLKDVEPVVEAVVREALPGPRGTEV